MEGQPADEECKNDRENDSARSLFPDPLQAPCTNAYGHIRNKYYQEWDEEAHNKAKNVETVYLFMCHGITAVNLVPAQNLTSKNTKRDAADHCNHPDDSTYELSLADCALVMRPHHHPDRQATIQAYGCQKIDTGKHVDNNHEAVELAHDMPKLPVVILRERNDREYQEGCKEEVSQGQVEKPN